MLQFIFADDLLINKDIIAENIMNQKDLVNETDLTEKELNNSSETISYENISIMNNNSNQNNKVIKQNVNTMKLSEIISYNVNLFNIIWKYNNVAYTIILIILLILVFIISQLDIKSIEIMQEVLNLVEIPMFSNFRYLNTIVLMPVQYIIKTISSSNIIKLIGICLIYLYLKTKVNLLFSNEKIEDNTRQLFNRLSINTAKQLSFFSRKEIYYHAINISKNISQVYLDLYVMCFTIIIISFTVWPSTTLTKIFEDHISPKPQISINLIEIVFSLINTNFVDVPKITHQELAVIGFVLLGIYAIVYFLLLKLLNIPYDHEKTESLISAASGIIKFLPTFVVTNTLERQLKFTRQNKNLKVFNSSESYYATKICASIIVLLIIISMISIAVPKILSYLSEEFKKNKNDNLLQFILTNIIALLFFGYIINLLYIHNQLMSMSKMFHSFLSKDLEILKAKPNANTVLKDESIEQVIIRNFQVSYNGLDTLISGEYISILQGLNAIVGPNGAGKSTLFHILTGNAPDFIKGTVILKLSNGKLVPLSSIAQSDLSEYIQLITSADVLDSNKTIFELFQFNNKNVTLRRVFELLQIVNLSHRFVSQTFPSDSNLESALKKKLPQLSGGEYHRLLFAISLASNTMKALLIDEVLDSCDFATFAKIIDYLQSEEFISKKIPVLIITHHASYLETKPCQFVVISSTGDITNNKHDMMTVGE